MAALGLRAPVRVEVPPGPDRESTPRPGDPAVHAIKAPPAVFVVLPVFNETRQVGTVFDAVAGFVERHPNFTFLFVDDGSTDGTGDRLRDRVSAGGSRRVRMHSYRENRGKGWAIREGVRAAAGDLVCFTDGDLAYPLDHLPRLVAALEENDVVIGSRGLEPHVERNTTLLRRLLGWSFNKIVRIVLGLPFCDTQAGLKGFRMEAARRITGMQRLSGFAFDVEILYLARKLGYRVGEIAAHVSPTHSYKASRVNLLRDPLRMFLAVALVAVNDARGLYD